MSNRPLIDPLTDSLVGLTEAERSDAVAYLSANLKVNWLAVTALLARSWRPS